MKRKFWVIAAIIVFILLSWTIISFLRLDAKVNYIRDGLGKLQMREEVCGHNIYDCEDFETQELAQKILEFCGYDIHILDKDGDRIACEELQR